jgi:A/G-specific adenine glycosylase
MDAATIEMNLLVGDLLAWYDSSCRSLPWRRDRDPYRIWVSEVMLQQTQVATAVPYYLRFLERFPDIKSLAGAELDDLLRLWQGLGYYQRARNLQRAARLVQERYDGVIPADRAAFLALPGVGDYIAAAVLSQAFNQPLAVVDGNVIRVASRYWGIDRVLDTPVKKRGLGARLEREMPPDRCGDFNQALMELGAMVCRVRDPDCPGCPLRGNCYAQARGLQALLPPRRQKAPRPRYTVALAVIVDQGRILIQKRPEAGHLGGLWEFPGGKVMTEETPVEAVKRECREEIGCDFVCRNALEPFLHVYTHFEIVVYGFVGEINAQIPVPRLGQPLRWMDWAAREAFAFPAANQRIFQMIGEPP